MGLYKSRAMGLNHHSKARGITLDHEHLETDGEFFDILGANNIWTHPQFLVSDVCKITGATPKALEHFVNPKRDLVRLVGPHVNPGTGRRRVFSGGQVLMIASAFAMTRIGFPQRFVRTLADEVERRAQFRNLPFGNIQTGMMIATYPMNESDDWNMVRIYNEMEREPILPIAVHLLDIDRLIDQVTAQLTAMINDEDVPDFIVPDPEPELNPYSPASNFFRAWGKSESGRWVYVGLTEDETDELMDMQGTALDGDDLVIIGERRRGGERFNELFDKHERVRLKLCAESVGRD